ncbi:MAG: ABC transporter ATP-binding protein [Mobilitalea sp.]
MDYSLEITNLSKQLEKFQLQNINITLEPGYIMGLIGPNGSGKTTLILTLLGLYKPQEGNIKICGYDLETQEKAAKSQIGFVLDENPFLENVSARDNAKMYGRYYPRWDQKTFDQYCKQFEVDIKRPLKKLSKGTKMKFQLAFALSHDAKLLVLDEPTAGLDPVFRRELLEIMCDTIADGERSILFSTHLTDELDKLADYITFILNGRQLFSLSKEELMERYGLVRGTEKQIRGLEDGLVIGNRIGENFAEALIRKDIGLVPMELQLIKPTIEDIMYYTVKSI